MIQDIEKYAQAIIDVGAEVDSHIDGDARIQTFTFNEAQVIAFAELVAEKEVKADRERVCEWLGNHTVWDNEYVYLRKSRMIQAFKEDFLSDNK